jgi:hypothetical protein
MAMLKVGCPTCDAAIPYVPELAGREIFCLGCGRHFVVPDLGPSASPSGEANPSNLIRLVVPSASEPKGQVNAETTPDGYGDNSVPALPKGSKYDKMP